MDVLVSGGGIAGCAVAIALRRHGIPVRVVEAHPRPDKEVGGFLGLAVNALRALDVIGVREAVTRKGFEVATQRMWNGTGKSLGVVARGRRRADPTRSITLRRHDLVAALRRAAVDAGAEFTTGTAVTGIDQRTDGVGVTLADGTRLTGDVLIGADGVHSVTRSVIAPESVAHYTGMYSLSGVSDGHYGQPGSFNMVMGRRATFLHLPVPDGTTWWGVQVADPRQPDRDDDPSGRRDGLAELFADDPVVLPVLSAARRLLHPPAAHWGLAGLPPAADGRIALIGDAAHPVGSGQGAAMAIEDAVVLADRLARGHGDVVAAPADYARTRRPRIEKVMATAENNSDLKSPGPVKRRLRDLMMPIAMPVVFERATGWLYDHDISQEISTMADQ